MNSAAIEKLWLQVNRGIPMPPERSWDVLLDNVRLREQIRAFCQHMQGQAERRELRQELGELLLVLEGHSFNPNPRGTARPKRFYHQEDNDE